jgi:beta-galactosidase
MGKKSDTDPGADHWPRNMVNGFTSADNWSFCYTIIMDQGHKTRWTLELPKEEELVSLKIQPSRIYHPITRIDLYFDEDPVPVPVELRVDPVVQEISFPPRKAKRVTMQVAKWAERGDANIVVIDNLWLMAKRPDDYLKRVKPLLNVGGLVRYDEGKGGIVLNQLKLVEREVNPVNAEKKRTVAKTILANLGAVFAGQKTVVAGSQLQYAPLALPVEKCTAYVNRDKQPAWWNGPGDLSGLPVGEQTFAGTRFLLPKFTTSPVPTVFMLRGRGGSVQQDRIDGLPVGRKADALFFLHTFNENGDLARRLNEMRERRADGKDPGEFPVVLTYAVRYADGQTAEVPVRYSRDIGNWLSPAPAGLANAAVAWAASAGDRQTVVWSMQWTNPRPEAAIASIDLIAGEEKWGSAAVFAITAATVAP